MAPTVAGVGESQILRYVFHGPHCETRFTSVFRCDRATSPGRLRWKQSFNRAIRCARANTCANTCAYSIACAGDECDSTGRWSASVTKPGLRDLTTTATGTIGVTVDWTLSTNNVDIYLTRGTDPCTVDQFNNRQCSLLGFSESTGAKPETLSVPNLAAGPYTSTSGTAVPPTSPFRSRSLLRVCRVRPHPQCRTRGLVASRATSAESLSSTSSRSV